MTIFEGYYISDGYVDEEWHAGVNSLSIFDIAGKKVLEMSGQGSDELQINLERFENGVYQIKVEDMDGNLIIKKIIKN